MTTQPLPAVVGERVRTLRERAGRSQDELAAAARECGLDWTRGSVASLEVGRRGLSAEELLLLPSVLWTLTGEEVGLADLVPGTGRVAVGTQPPGGHGWIGGRTLREFLGGRRRRLPGPTHNWPTRERFDEMRVVTEDASRDAVVRAARRLGVPPYFVSLTAYQTWGRPFVDERDARVSAVLEEGADPRRAQAVRGHITRQMIQELFHDDPEEEEGQ